MTVWDYVEKYDKPRSEWETLIDEWIFNAEDRVMLKMRLLDGLTIDEIAETLNLSDKTIKRRLRKSQNRLFVKAGA